MDCDASVVALWAEKLAPFCNETPAVCEQWLGGFLTAIRLARCRALPEEPLSCGHENPMTTPEPCHECQLTMARRQGHSEAGVYWTAGEVIELASSR